MFLNNPEFLLNADFLVIRDLDLEVTFSLKCENQRYWLKLKSLGLYSGISLVILIHLQILHTSVFYKDFRSFTTHVFKVICHHVEIIFAWLFSTTVPVFVASGWFQKQCVLSNQPSSKIRVVHLRRLHADGWNGRESLHGWAGLCSR